MPVQHVDAQSQRKYTVQVLAQKRVLKQSGINKVIYYMSDIYNGTL